MISCFITTSPTKVLGARRVTSIGKGSPAFIPRGRGIDDEVVARRIVRAQPGLDFRVVMLDPAGERVRPKPRLVSDRKSFATPSPAIPSGDGAPAPPVPTTRAAGPFELKFCAASRA